MAENVSTTIDGDTAYVRPLADNAGEVAQALLDAADNPRQVKTDSTRPGGVAFRVPAEVAAAAGFSDTGPEGTQATRRTGGAETTPEKRAEGDGEAGDGGTDYAAQEAARAAQMDAARLEAERAATDKAEQEQLQADADEQAARDEAAAAAANADTAPAEPELSPQQKAAQTRQRKAEEAARAAAAADQADSSTQ